MDRCRICGEASTRGNKTVLLTAEDLLAINKASKVRMDGFKEHLARFAPSRPLYAHPFCRKDYVKEKNLRNAIKRRVAARAEVSDCKFKRTVWPSNYMR